MCAKMNVFGLLLCVLSAILLAKCEETHHIEQRILENQQQNLTASGNNDTDSERSSSFEEASPELDPPAQLKRLTTFGLGKNISSSDGGNNSHVDVTYLMRGNISEILNSELKSNLSADAEGNNSDSANAGRSLILESNNTHTKTETEEKIDTEVKDLLNQNSQKIPVEIHQHPLEPLEPEHIPDKIDKQTELIEDGENTEDILRRHSYENISDSSHGPLAIILVTMLVALSVMCYAGLLLWRRYLENLYGSRTLLVDAEELAERDDLRHFTI